MGRKWLPVLFFAAVLALAGSFQPARGSMPFNPSVDLFVSSPQPSANSDIRIAVSLPPGHHSLGTWSFLLPAGWNVSADSNVFNGDVVARGTMSVDTDCNGSIESYGPFNLVDTPVATGGDAPVAQWVGQIASWWDLLLVVDQQPGDPFDVAADLTNFSVFHTTCAPQTLTITVLGRSVSHNNVVLTNPSSSAMHVWEGSFATSGGEHITNVNEPVCVGNNCDRDVDTIADVIDNCDTWPNPAQNLPPWTVPAGDPDCDGFSSAIEDPVGTNALVQCGVNAWPADITNDSFSDISDVSALTASFGSQVPPAAPRLDIAPDPVDGFVDITDISRMTSFFGYTCAPCPADFDCDAVGNATDNCPNWPNPTQGLPLWPIPPNDPDCDGFSSGVEASAGTDPFTHCGLDDWPADLNSDTFSDITDVSALTANFGVQVPSAPARQDIAPDPVDGFVDITDISKMTSFFGYTCD